MQTKRLLNLTDSIRSKVQAEDGSALEELFARLHPWDAARLVSQLPIEEQKQVFLLLRPGSAADVVEEMPEHEAARVITELPPEQAADVVEEMDSNDEADLLQQLPPEEQKKILDHMESDDKEEAIEMLSYPADTAGGIMKKEFISFDESSTVGEVLQAMRDRTTEFSNFRISYIYILSKARHLIGVLPLRDLIMRDASMRVSQVMIKDPASVPVGMDQEEVAGLFEHYHYLAMPVVDADGRMVGVVSQDDALEVMAKEGSEDLLKFSGIVGGEETHDMPLPRRASRRLAWLSVNIVLNFVAASVIWAHEATLEAVIGIVMFLPIISDMSGCSGNQSIAVSIRELAVGRIKPRDFLKVWFAEASVGIINGLILGAQLAIIAGLLKGSVGLALVVGGALFLTTLLSVTIGSMVPLLLKKLGRDPALSSAPILTTLTDLCGFSLLLTLTSLFLMGNGAGA